MPLYYDEETKTIKPENIDNVLFLLGDGNASEYGPTSREVQCAYTKSGGNGDK